MRATASFNFDEGITTSSWNAVFALRSRVSMSAIGSVIVTVTPPSPRRLRHAGDLPCVRHVAQADPAQAEVAVHGPRAPTAAAARVGAHLELGRPLLLVDQSLLRHTDYPCWPSRRNGKPSARSSARPCSSVSAVVTIVMSMPRTASILS